MQRPFYISDIMSSRSILPFLATAGRCSEVAAFLRLSHHLKFLDFGAVSLLPLPYFVANNEDPDHRFKPNITQPFFSINHNHVQLMLLKMNFLSLLLLPTHSKSSKSLKNISTTSLYLLVCKTIRASCS